MNGRGGRKKNRTGDQFTPALYTPHHTTSPARIHTQNTQITHSSCTVFSPLKVADQETLPGNTQTHIKKPNSLTVRHLPLSTARWTERQSPRGLSESERKKWTPCRKKQSRRKLRTLFLNFTSFIPILLYPVILTNVTQATRVLLCILLHWRDCLFWKKLHKKHEKLKICSRKSSRKSCYNQTLNITRRVRQMWWNVWTELLYSNVGLTRLLH